ncbi:MAG TPA: hypothetical protein VIB47_11415 [Dehalococcoidia bacterium]|jgi:hypothetical protein
MAEGQPTGASDAGQGDMVPELEPKQFEQLAEIVYRMLRDEMLLELERRGAPSVRDRR